MASKTIIILLALLLLTGCWSRRELNDMLIVLGLSIDWVDQEYLVSFQVVNPSEISSQRTKQDQPPVTLFQGRGKTLFEAARALSAEAPRKFYLGHLEIFVMSESLARRGLYDFIDVLLRDNETRMDFKVVVARGTPAENILKIFTPIEKLPTRSMKQSLETSEKNWAPTVSMNLDDVLNMLSRRGEELALTGIQIVGDLPKSESKRNVQSFKPLGNFRYTGIAAFKRDKLVGWLNEEESKGYSDITNKLQSTSISLACGNQNYMGMEVTSSKSKIRMNVRNGKPEARVRIRSEVTIVNRPCLDVDLTDPATIRKLQKELEQIIESHANSAIKRAKQWKTDIFGFGERLAKTHPHYWESVKTSWSDEYFPELSVQYEIEVKIRKTGTIGNSMLKQTE